MLTFIGMYIEGKSKSGVTLFGGVLSVYAFIGAESK